MALTITNSTEASCTSMPIAIVTPPNSDKATLQIHQGVSQRVDQNANC